MSSIARQTTRLVANKAIKRRPAPLVPRGSLQHVLRPVPPTIPRPDYAANGKAQQNTHVARYSADEIKCIAKACEIAAQVRQYAGTLIKPGVTTDSIDEAVHNKIIALGAYPSPLNYCNFPKSVCTSVNEVVVHGIPDDRQLVDGDIINIDVSTYYGGFHGDCNATFLVGEVDEAARRLVEVTKAVTLAAIAVCKPGARLSLIGETISSLTERMSRKYGARYGLVDVFSGHGIGRNLHELPYILHYRNREEGTMQPGMVFTIEPMLTEGTAEVNVWPDGWTAVTLDGGWSAQFEETLTITETGARVLTCPEIPSLNLQC